MTVCGTGEPVDRGRAQEVPARAATTARRGHLFVLVVCLAMIAGAFVLDPVEAGADGERIRFAGARVPEVCLFKATTAVPCPGCGLTRSWVAAVRGHVRASLAFHPLGWLILLYVTAQSVRHGAWLALPSRRMAVDRVGARLDRGLIALAILLVVAWIPTAAGTLASAF